MKRRTFIKAAGVSSAATLMSGLPAGWVGSVYADDSPEIKAMRFGMIALTDCAPIVMAHELGYFKKFGIESTISKEASWAVIRDKLSLGENHATHMLIGMPIASTMGLAGSPVKPMVRSEERRVGTEGRQERAGARARGGETLWTVT